MDEPLPADTEDQALKPSPYKSIVKVLFEEHPAGEFREFLRIGQLALEANDLTLTKAIADHVMARATTGSGDMMRAMLLRAWVYERSRNISQFNTLINAVCGGRF